MGTPRSTLPSAVIRAGLHLLLVVASGFVLGGLTSFAQTFLPDALRPFAKSASGWTLLTAVIVWGSRSRPALSAVSGALSFAMLVLGYQTVSTLRGYVTSEELFLAIGLVVGPFIGVAASWLRRTDVYAALGCAVVSGVAVGESLYGLVLLSPVDRMVLLGPHRLGWPRPAHRRRGADAAPPPRSRPRSTSATACSASCRFESRDPRRANGRRASW